MFEVLIIEMEVRVGVHMDWVTQGNKPETKPPNMINNKSLLDPFLLVV